MARYTEGSLFIHYFKNRYICEWIWINFYGNIWLSRWVNYCRHNKILSDGMECLICHRVASKIHTHIRRVQNTCTVWNRAFEFYAEFDKTSRFVLVCCAIWHQFEVGKREFHQIAAEHLHEVKRFGVRVVNVEPGVIMTSIFDNSAETTRYDKTSPYQPIMRRNGKLFAAGFRVAAQADEVAAKIIEAITTDDYRLRWYVGNDAIGMANGRPKISDEEWVAMGDEISDVDYNERFARYFGVSL